MRGELRRSHCPKVLAVPARPSAVYADCRWATGRSVLEVPERSDVSRSAINRWRSALSCAIRMARPRTSLLSSALYSMFTLRNRARSVARSGIVESSQQALPSPHLNALALSRFRDVSLPHMHPRCPVPAPPCDSDNEGRHERGTRLPFRRSGWGDASLNSEHSKGGSSVVLDRRRSFHALRPAAGQESASSLIVAHDFGFVRLSACRDGPERLICSLDIRARSAHIFAKSAARHRCDHLVRK